MSSYNPTSYLTPEQSELFVIGLPLSTKYGFIKPIKVKEYPTLLTEIEILKMAEWEVKSLLKKDITNHLLKEDLTKDLKSMSLIELIQNNFLGLRDKYSNIFSKIIVDFDQKTFFKIRSQDEFDALRFLILDYNGISYIVWEKNAELRYYQKLELYYNKATGASVDFDATFTSLVAIGHKPHDINDFTLNQFYATFKRIQFFKAHETTTLFKTVDGKNSVEIVEWFASSKDKEKQDKSVEEIINENKKFSKQ